MKPSNITLHKKSKTLEVIFAGQAYTLPAEFLRTHSPSAEVRGHGVGNEVLVFEKIEVGITSVNAVGNYGLQVHFTDGHNSGIFSWIYLQELGKNQTALWESYLTKLKAANKTRDPHTNVVQFQPL